MATYVELKGYGQGRPEKGANLACFSLDEIAKELNMSKRNLLRALRIERNLTDSMKELLDTGNKIKYRSPKIKTTKHALKRVLVVFYYSYNLNSALNYNEEGTGTFILNALKIAL